MEVFTSAWLWLLNETMWLPKNSTWQELEMLPHYPKANDLWVAIVVAFGFLVLRNLLDRILFIPVGTTLGVSSKTAQVQYIPLLEKAYKENNIEKHKIEEMALQLNWTTTMVEIWLRRKKQNVARMKKFTEGAGSVLNTDGIRWRLMCYTLFVLFGTMVVYNETCIFNISKCFQPVAKQQIPTAATRWYNLLEIGFYIALAVSLVNDVRRKDFKIMALHHVYTLTLFFIGWMLNVLRTMNLIMLCHDIADIPLEAVKLVGLVKRKPLSPLGFIVFLAAWVFGRILYFPFLVNGCIMYGKEYAGPIPYFVLNGLLVCLFKLHLLWTWMIIKILYNTITTKALVDVRSDDESSSDHETSKQKSK